MNQLKKFHIRQWHINLAAVLYTLLCSLLIVSVAFAHDAPPGDDYEMADWMLFSFLIFFGASFFVFLVAMKRGWMRQPENAKYYILSIDEGDYYTPDWARDPELEDGLEQRGDDTEQKEVNHGS
jgi:hypothetical protein